MKNRSIAVFTVALAAILIGTLTPLRSQDQVPPPSGVPEPPPPPAAPNIRPLLDDVRRQVDAAREQAEVAFGAAGDVFTSFVGGDGNFQFRPGARAARSLVIASSEMDADTLSTAEEVMNIMARILDKALPGRDGDKPDRRAMGIAISGPAGAAVRNLYLEGYGAVFFLDVRFPLLPPPKKEDPAKPKEPTSSAWEEARSELYSRRGARGDGATRGWDARSAAPHQASEEYADDKVERLKESLLDALKNATHLRNVKADEAVALVISGGETSHLEVGRVGPDVGRVTSKPEPKRRTEVYSVNATGYVWHKGGRSTTMVIRAKKSDIDAFAKGDLNAEQFKKKVGTRVY